MKRIRLIPIIKEVVLVVLTAGNNSVKAILFTP
jgi:hypothetical protein